MKSAIAIRHLCFEDLGILAPLLDERSWHLRYVDAGIDELAPADMDAADVLIVLGGPIGVYEENIYPFLKDELCLIERRLALGKPIVGICLGAQLIARALGERVYKGRAKEIGYAPIRLTSDGLRSPLAHIAGAGNMVLHWHGDTFDLPRDATLLASTEITENQAFAIGTNVLALQFHIEADHRAIERWLIGHACELGAAKMDVTHLRADAAAIGPAVAAAGRRAFEQWFAEAGLTD